MLPDTFGRLPADEDWKDSSVPAGLILVRGDSQNQPSGTRLLWGRNTDGFAGWRTGTFSPGGGPQLGGSRRL